MIPRLLTGSLAAAGASSAIGAVLDLDFGAAGYGDGLTLDVNNQGYVYIDISAGSVTFGPGRDPSLTEIRASFSPIYYGYNDTNGAVFTLVGDVNSQGVLFQAGAAFWLDRIGYATELDANLRSTFGGLGEGDVGPSPWGNGFTGVAFVAFQLQGNSGWLAVDFQPYTQQGSVELLQLQYGNAGETMTTPAAGTYAPIPEPAVAASLLAGCAAVFALRKRRR